jgi:hypothetical protein
MLLAVCVIIFLQLCEHSCCPIFYLIRCAGWIYIPGSWSERVLWAKQNQQLVAPLDYSLCCCPVCVCVSFRL